MGISVLYSIIQPIHITMHWVLYVPLLYNRFFFPKLFVLFSVLWLDCDKEGENICFEVMNCVLHVMKPRRNEQTVFRAKFCKFYL